jgi:hypothetical protein
LRRDLGLPHADNVGASSFALIQRTDEATILFTKHPHDVEVNAGTNADDGATSLPTVVIVPATRELHGHTHLEFQGPAPLSDAPVTPTEDRAGLRA